VSVNARRDLNPGRRSARGASDRLPPVQISPVALLHNSTARSLISAPRRIVVDALRDSNQGRARSDRGSNLARRTSLSRYSASGRRACRSHRVSVNARRDSKRSGGAPLEHQVSSDDGGHRSRPWRTTGLTLQAEFRLRWVAPGGNDPLTGICRD